VLADHREEVTEQLALAGAQLAADLIERGARGLALGNAEMGMPGRGGLVGGEFPVAVCAI